ncbi:hypothetical protein IFM89_001860 [Coptis chinensis]|uniref:F-box domain-containing protein n=1 Tax=Coptis chinensis TaxID=261450 RepID=A0A835HKB7_9MAGN|nr:hypothetical protein IFM89_001860 [Coptis chinensis]
MKQVFSCFDQKKNRISHMPDPIRSHIVSFLPMKEAMRSSILSRQWRYVCSSLSNLKFDQVDFEKTKKHKRGDFRDFVDETLLSHNGSDIKSFSLTVKLGDTFITSCHLNSWISFAVKHNVQDFKFSSYTCRLEKLPQCLFTSTTLTKLSLYEVELNLPTIVKFPVLKSLLFDDVAFRGENLVNKLLSSSTCPVLEKLVIWYCCCSGINTISISLPTLKYLTLFDTHELTINLVNTVLRELIYMCCRPPNITYENLLSVVSAKLHFSLHIGLCATPDNTFFRSASKILVWLRNVEKLCLMSGIIEDKATISNMANVDECWKPTQLPSEDILNGLKTVDIEDFKGSDGELYLVRFLLENAKILEKMHICCSDEKGLETVRCQMCITEILPKFTKVSPHVTISISDILANRVWQYVLYVNGQKKSSSHIYISANKWELTGDFCNAVESNRELTEDFYKLISYSCLDQTILYWCVQSDSFLPSTGDQRYLWRCFVQVDGFLTCGGIKDSSLRHCGDKFLEHG